MQSITLTSLLAYLLLLFGCNSKVSADQRTDEYSGSNKSEQSKHDTETFNPIDSHVIADLNSKILAMKITTIENVVGLYKPQYQNPEGNYSYTHSHTPIHDQIVEVTLIEAGLPDDSVEAIKSVIRIQHDNSTLQVIAIKENYRCYRGHKDWSAERCI